MITFKCKMCGGDLHPLENATTCECEYCGSVQTIPTADNEKKMNLFSRAQRLLRSCEFDKAAGVYESIVAEFPEEAEAYWGLVLCKYGIEYVDDPATGKKVPTCHRSSFDSVMEDSNFEQACENADAVARRVYRDEAKAIEELRKGIIEVSGKEEPYDIFICYKETDENGNRTLDSVLAQDIYDALIEKGYRVFFSRITLEDKLGQEYEPYIFAALNSAKVMLAVGTDYEYFNAVWVKNEWSRFLKQITSGEKKALIPCYKGIDAYDMPKEFAKLQAQDMGKIGAIQDLLRGINKILSVKEDSNGSGSAPLNNTQTIKNYLGIANSAYDAGNYTEAEAYCNKVFEIEPTNNNTWLIKGKTAGKQSSIQNIRISEMCSSFLKAIEYASETDKNIVRQEIEKNMSLLLMEVVKQGLDDYSQTPDKNHVDAVTKIIATVVQSVNRIKKEGICESTNIFDDIGNGVLKVAKQTKQNAINKLKSKEFPISSDGDQFIDNLGNIIGLLEKTVDVLGEDISQIDEIYTLLMELYRLPVDTEVYQTERRDIRQELASECPYSYGPQRESFINSAYDTAMNGLRKEGIFYEESSKTIYYKFPCITNKTDAAQRGSMIAKYKKRIEEIHREKAQKRLIEYWKIHSKEKKTLEEEKQSLTTQISAIEKEIKEHVSELSRDMAGISMQTEVREIEKEIERLEAHLKSLGLFKGKEKKTTQQSIENLRQKRNQVLSVEREQKNKSQKDIDMVKAEGQRKTKPLYDRIRAIEVELTKPR